MHVHKLNDALLDLVNFMAVDWKTRNRSLNSMATLCKHQKEIGTRENDNNSDNAVTRGVATKRKNE